MCKPVYACENHPQRNSRSVQLIWSAEKDNPTVWADFVSKVKEGVLSSFDAALAQREEEMKRSEGQRTMPGWNFCTFFILKASSVKCLFGRAALVNSMLAGKCG